MLAALALLLFAAAAPEDAIRDVVLSQQEAWNKGDIEAFMRFYENSPQTTYIGRSVLKGYQAILDNYRKRYPGKDGMGRLTFSEIEVRMIAPDAAITTGRYQVARPQQHGGDATGRFTLILKRNPSSQWRIVHDHSS